MQQIHGFEFFWAETGIFRVKYITTDIWNVFTQMVAGAP